MRATVRKSELNGSIEAPASKSYTHRAIVCSLLSQHTTTIVNPLFCYDTEASLQLSKMMGAQIVRKDLLKITGPERLIAPLSDMNCRGSGTTLRIFTALASLTDGRCVLTGDPSLRERPIIELLQALNQLGVSTFSHQQSGRPPVEVHGNGLHGGSVSIRGDVSSQYISGLLLAGPKADDDTRIEITTNLESKPYVEMTIEVMNHFGVSVDPSTLWNTFRVPGNQVYKAAEYSVPGDYSSAAFPLAAGIIGGRVRVTGLNRDSKQGDSQILQFMSSMGALVKTEGGSITASHSDLKAIDFDVTHTPDLVPILAVLATQANGTSRIYNAERLRIKESDRLATTTTELKKMGARIDETTDGLAIEGPTKLHGAVVTSHNDHRIAMACFVAGLIANGPTTINGIECVAKSYPEFLDHMQSLGADIKIENERRSEL